MEDEATELAILRLGSISKATSTSKPTFSLSAAPEIDDPRMLTLLQDQSLEKIVNRSGVLRLLRYCDSITLAQKHAATTSNKESTIALLKVLSQKPETVDFQTDMTRKYESAIEKVYGLPTGSCEVVVSSRGER